MQFYEIGWFDDGSVFHHQAWAHVNCLRTTLGMLKLFNLTFYMN